ncbi:unnamed protein product [Vicia faba]|uniref:Uncharacterized protein n=1 Tax=Vicia faba TaxID=3906 RepID=A0AAV1ANL2_VICFA|nr:unnamed protein product [Vicia faba]
MAWSGKLTCSCRCLFLYGFQAYAKKRCMYVSDTCFMKIKHYFVLDYAKLNGNFLQNSFTQIKAEMDKTLKWLVPFSANKIKSDMQICVLYLSTPVKLNFFRKLITITKEMFEKTMSCLKRMHLLRCVISLHHMK